MSLKIQNSRQLLKRSTISGATPSVFTGSTDYTDGTWGVDDIYGGEFYWNMADKKLFLGWETSGGTGIEQIFPFGGGSGNCITDLYLTNMYGCSPINVWDNFLMQTGATIQSFDGAAFISLDFAGISEISLNWADANFNSVSTISNGITHYTEDIGSGQFTWIQQSSANWELSTETSNLFQFLNTSNPSSDSVVIRGEGNLKLESNYNDAGASYLYFQQSAVTISTLEQIISVNDGVNVTEYKQQPQLVQIKAQDIGVAQYANKIAVDATAANIHAEDMSNGYVADVSVSLTNPQAVIYVGDGVNDVQLTIKPTIANLTNVPAYDDDADATIAGLVTGDIYQTTGGGSAPLNEAGILMIKQ